MCFTLFGVALLVLRILLLLLAYLGHLFFAYSVLNKERAVYRLAQVCRRTIDFLFCK